MRALCEFWSGESLRSRSDCARVSVCSNLARIPIYGGYGSAIPKNLGSSPNTCTFFVRLYRHARSQ